MRALSAEQATEYQRTESNFKVPNTVYIPDYHKFLIHSLAKEFRNKETIRISGIKKINDLYMGNFFPKDPVMPVNIHSKGSKENPLIPILCITKRLEEEGRTIAFYGTCFTGKNEISDSQNIMSLFYFSNCGCGEVRISTSFNPFQYVSKEKSEKRKMELISSLNHIKSLENYFGDNTTSFLSEEVRKHKWFLGQKFKGLTPQNAIQDYEEQYGRGLTDLIIEKESQILERIH